METQLNSSETDIEDSEQLNTEEVFTENDMLFEQKVTIIQRRRKCKWY